MQIAEFDNFQDLENIKNEWDEFIESLGTEIFLSFDWCRTWWKYYGSGRELKIFICRKDNKIAALLPFFTERLWAGPIPIRALKFVSSDFTISHFSIPIHPDFLESVINILFNKIIQSSIDIIHLGPIAGIYGYYEKLLNIVNDIFSKSYDIESQNSGVQTYFNLSDNWEDYISRLSKSQRQNLRWNYNNISKELNLSIKSEYIDENNFDAEFDKFVVMHQQYWNSMGKSGHFLDWPHSLDFHKEISKSQLAKGRVKLLKVKIDDKVIGYSYQYKFSNKYLHYLNSRTEEFEEFKRYSIGKITMSEQYKKSIEDKNYCIDDMRGFYDHKVKMGGVVHDVHSIYISRNGTITKQKVKIFRLYAKLFHLFYYRIWFLKINPKLPVKNKSLWKTYIRIKDFA